MELVEKGFHNHRRVITLPLTGLQKKSWYDVVEAIGLVLKLSTNECQGTRWG